MKEEVKKMLSLLTLEEKAALASGVGSWNTAPINRVGLPSARVSDGPHGVRKEVELKRADNFFREAYPSTCFPPAVTLASSWDRELVHDVGKAIGEECIGLEVDAILGPGINIKRNPMCGRNFEYFSEDPYLAGELATSYINGVQFTGTGVSLKHFAVNSQEHKRMEADSIVDERTLREIYLAAFERAVKKSAPATVMCSYNLVNGTHSAENKRLLTDILRKEWGFEGMVVSDWGAVCDRVQGVLSGLNLEMPSSSGVRDAEIVAAVKANKLTEAELDACIAPVVEFAMNSARHRMENKGFKVDFAAHHKLAKRAAEGGAVLLKNNGALPLSEASSFAVVGEMAKVIRSQGSGSSRLNPIKEQSFTAYLDELGVKYSYAKAYEMHNDKPIKSMIDEAVNVAKGKNAVLVFVGLTDDFESEAFDREHINIPHAHNELVERLCAEGDNVIAVVTGGSAMKLPWLDKVNAVLYLGLTGEAGGEATYDLLFGKACPSGKLAETFPFDVEDVPSTSTFRKDQVLYKESVFVGYRYFETAGVKVQFPFGYGLSYTDFKYSNLILSRQALSDGDTLVVTADVENTGEYDGAEVIQLYVRDRASTIYRPDKELKGFEKVFLRKGEKKTVRFTLDKRAFAFYNVLQEDWTVERGEFSILVGSSVADIKLSEDVTYNAPDVVIPDYRTSAVGYYDLSGGLNVTEGEFERVYARPLPEFNTVEKGKYTMDTVIGDLNGSGFPKLLKFIIGKGSTFVLPKNADPVTKKMVYRGAMDMPLRNFYAMSNGIVSKKSCEGLLVALNGRFFKGLIQFIGGFFGRTELKEKKYKV